MAGSFYPAASDELAALVDSFLAAVPEPDGGHRPVGLVVPHAGYVYSGPIAASGYAHLAAAGDAIRRVVVLGPTHFVRLDGLAVPTAGGMETPLGEARVDTAACGLLVEDGLAEHADLPHAQEHSIEVQLPFLQRVLADGATYVPVAVGPCEPEDVADALDRLDGDLVVVSTDLSHYLPQARAQQRDRRTAEAVVARRPEEIGWHDACGLFALRGVLVWARRHDHGVDLADLRTSADTVGNPDRVVGYGAFVIGTDDS